MSDLADFALNYMQTNRGKPVRRGYLVSQLVSLSRHARGAWPKGRDSEWSAAVDELIAGGRLTEDDDGVRFVPDPEEAKPAESTQGELF